MTCDCCKCHAFLKRKDLEAKACPRILDPLNPLKITSSFKDDPDLGYHIRWLSGQLKSGHPLRQAIKHYDDNSPNPQLIDIFW
jgi:hypothetical protein